VTVSTGIISTIAGNGAAGYSGDGGLATSARLNYPSGVSVDWSGHIFIADLFNGRIRVVTGTPPEASQTLPPSETETSVNVSYTGCGDGGVMPCTVTYNLAFGDLTPGATIYYTIFCTGGLSTPGTGLRYLTSGQAWPGQQLALVQSYPSGNCYGGYLSGTMYATALGYTQSITESMSF
jgi:hypothetical protein